MANSQNFSDQSGAPKNSTGKTLLNCFGIGCGTLFVLFIVLPALAFGAGPGGGSYIAIGFMALIVITLIVVSRRNARKAARGRGNLVQAPKSGGSEADAYSVTQQSKYFAEPPRPTVDGGAKPNLVIAPACQHVFNVTELQDRKQVTCVCGRKYPSADLLEYKRLQDVIADASSSLEEIRFRLASVEISDSVSAKFTDTRKAAPAPVKVKPPKAKVNLSLQQWLIIGASILVLVAGSVFVSTNIQTMPQWQFELITIGVALATGFGAFKGRAISVLLSNFLAAFSSSMQLATLSIIGDQISPDFIWSNAPAWWWAIELTVLSAAATVLAKFSRNFGWKGIALLASTGAALVLDLGLLQDKLAHNAFPIHLAVLSVTAVVVLAQNKFLRSVPQPEVTDKAFAEYAKELGEREDSSLRIFGQFSAALQIVVGIGVGLIGTFLSIPTPFELVPLLLLSAVWVPLWLLSRFWSDQLTKNGKAENLVSQISSWVIYVSLSLAATSASVSLFGRGTDVWLSGLVAAVLFTVLLLAARYLRKLSPTANVVTTGLWVGAAAWLDWQILEQGTQVEMPAAGLFLVSFGLLLSLADLRLGINRNRWIAPLVNGLGVVLFAIDVKIHNSPAYGSLAFALVAVLIVAGTNLQLPIRWFVAKQLAQQSSPTSNWLSFGLSALAIFYVQTPIVGASQDAAHNALVTMSLTFMVYSILAQALAIWSPLSRTFGTHLTANSYLGQWVTVYGILLSLGSTHPGTIATNALLIGCLAIINYAFGTLNRNTLKMQLGFAAALVSFLVYQWSLEDSLRAINPDWSVGSFGFAWKFALQLAVVSAATWLHTWFLRKRTQVSASTLIATPIVATGATLIAGVSALGYSLTHDGFTGLLTALINLSAAAFASVLLSRFGRLATVATRSSALGWVAVEYAGLGVLSNLVITSDQDFAGAHLRWILSTVVLAAVVQLKNVKLSNPALVIAFYLANLSTAWGAGQVTAEALHWGSAPEPFTIWFAAAFVVSTLLAGKQLGWLRTVLLIDVPLLGAAAVSAVYAFGQDTSSDVSTWRGVLAWAAIATHAYLRSKTKQPAVWLLVGYAAGAVSAWWLGAGVSRWFVPNFEGPEVYAILVTVSALIGHRVLVLRFKKTLEDLRHSITTGVLVLPSLAYALASDPNLIANQWRLVMAFAVISALAFWRLVKSKPVPWIVVSYLGSAGTALALANVIGRNWITNFEGPEIFSLLATVAVLGTHLVALPKLKLQGTLFSWGLPIGVALVPSTLFTYTSLNVPFQDLGAAQITRVIVVLLVSAALLVHGARFGNLANASMGIIGLALLVIPNTAMHSDNVVPGSQVESTALIIGGLLFVTLWLLGRYRKLAGNSLLFVGLPVVIVLAPALVRSLIALGNPSLTTVDWWRFAIVLTAAMTLLIVGTLREVAGMFYPGLVAVLLSALPYGFRQTGQDQWFLWVLLLLVAGVMVWLAVHLEKMKKAGRTSAVWLKELK